MDFGEAADGGEIFGRALEDELELGLRFVERAELDQRAAQRDAGREIAGMNREPGAADLDRFFVLPGAPAFFRELRESDRRRILLDPASKVVNARLVGHPRYGTVMVCDAVPVRGGVALSVTLNVTVNVVVRAGATGGG